MQNVEHPDLSSDGWRKKSCAGGAALMNFIGMGQNTSLMFNVGDYLDQRKDAGGIAEALITQAHAIAEQLDCSPERLASWVLDNTKANHAAMRIVSQRYPMWVMRGCAAHGLALALKDLCRHKVGAGRAQTWGCKWLAAVNDRANIIANFMNDSVGARGVVQQHHKQLYGRVRALPVSVPTRFATNLFVMKGVLSSEGAFKAAVADPAWQAQPVGNKAEEIQGLIEQLDLRTFWADLKLAVELLQPFCDMLHQIEGDRPALGRCFVGLRDLDSHVAACASKHKTEPAHIASAADTMLATWRRRYCNEGGTQVQKLMYPSYVRSCSIPCMQI